MTRADGAADEVVAPRKAKAAVPTGGRLVPLIMLALSVGVVGTIGEFVLGQLGWAFNAELGVPVAAIGSLASAMFIAAGIASPASGWLVDHVAPKVLLPVQAALAIAAFASFALARNEMDLLLVCIAVGVCMTIGLPLTNRMIALYLPARQHAVAVGWKSLGVQLSAVLVGLSFGGLAEVIEWRTIIWLWVGVSVAMTVCGGWYLARTPRLDRAAGAAGAADATAGAGGVDGAGGAVEPASPSAPAPVPAPRDRHHPVVWWLLPISFFFIGAFSSLGAYLPSFAIDQLGLGVGVAGLGMVVAATTSVVSRFVWLRLMRNVHGMTLLAAAGVLTAIGGAMLMVSPAIGEWFFWTAVVVLGAVALGSFPVGAVLLIQYANVAKIGAISAWSGLAGFAGLAVQPLFQSLLIEEGGLTAGWLVVVAGGLLTTLTVGVYFVVQSRSRAHRPVRRRRRRCRASA
ncbi:MFS transporter [Agromyces aerolatus]|uniref:MFS transporter n=1 Tax=Agromyces sp. LY-1074 TaxID=3074080 RepID=UPI00285F9C82|nr:MULTISPECIES: MFS transporter [unclassified Agromyces]MDR5699459.1 MFS transporter [Agromyces sp. LY-1074]MDR5705755.1 MFS transporter [Agromyces sp. LY-1358]